MENLAYIFLIIILYYVLKVCYFLTHRILLNNKDYIELHGDKKLYVRKNAIKSLALTIIAIINYEMIMEMLYYDYFSKNKVILTGIFYGINDTYGLINVPNLPFSTKIHHVVTTMLYLSTLLYDFTDLGYLRGIIVYALFSMFSGSVNGYLAYRFVYPLSKYRCYFKKFAYYNYLICFIGEWIYQYKVIINHFMRITEHNIYYNVGFLVYLSVIHMIVFDDIKLIQYLKKDARVYEHK